jgi:hypothetical protein
MTSMDTDMDIVNDTAPGDAEPLPEGFLEELETIAALRRPCELVFTGDNGGRAVLRDYIATLYIESGRGWLKTGGGIEIRLERLVQVDGMIPSKYC